LNKTSTFFSEKTGARKLGNEICLNFSMSLGLSNKERFTLKNTPKEMRIIELSNSVTILGLNAFRKLSKCYTKTLKK